MTWNSARILALIVLGALTASACENSPTEPTPETFTDAFSGTLGTGQTVNHQFTVHVEGAVTLVLLSMALETPPEDGSTPTIPPVGLAIGTWNGTNCTQVAVNAAAVAGTIISGTALPGEFCVVVYDSGSVATSVTYTGQVIHE